MEMREKTGTKTRKLIWDGELVSVSTLYQFATIFEVSVNVQFPYIQLAHEAKAEIHLLTGMSYHMRRDRE